jgi:hypothetical protein
MQENQNRSRPFGFRDVPKPLRFTVLVVPTAIAFSAFSVPANAQPVSTNAVGTGVHAHSPARSASSPLSSRASRAWLNAYFRAGYNYNDAVMLARLWSNATTPSSAKLLAGQMLTQRERLPIRPHQSVGNVRSETALDAFFNNGYDYQDAKKLAKTWKRPRDVAGAKMTAGRLILSGRPLPGMSANKVTSSRIHAFLHAGYSYKDAVLLARLWGFETSPYSAQLRAGDKLLDRERLPLRPNESPWRVKDRIAYDAFFNNGYDYQDASKLAKTWKVSTAKAKAMAGRKLMAGLALPLR